MSNNCDNSLIVKKTIYAGQKGVNFKDGTKVKFHYQTRKCDPNHTIIDDSRKMGDGKPFELVLGKKFKLEVWEAIVQKMALKEVASFTVDKSLVTQYPFVSKTLRDVHLKKNERKHTCAMTLQTEGLGYDDLMDLLKSGGDLEFIIELLEVEQPEDYNKESWQMTENERLEHVSTLKNKGNEEYNNKMFKEAVDHYAEAIGILEKLMLREKPHDKEWNDINSQKNVILLNYSQCKLNLGEYYDVIEHCTTILKTDPDNVKALFRRARANVGAWNPDQAKEDFARVQTLDSTLKEVVKKELNILDVKIREKDEIDRQKLKGLFA